MLGISASTYFVFRLSVQGFHLHEQNINGYRPSNIASSLSVVTWYYKNKKKFCTMLVKEQTAKTITFS